MRPILLGLLLAAADCAEAIVREIMVADTAGGAVLRGKTGWALSDAENLGWWVGWLERGGEAYFFALTVESADPDFDVASVHRPAAEHILAHLGLR